VSNDQLALKELFQASRRDAEHVFRHYLYFGAEQASAAAAEELRRSDFTTEERLGADEVSWLVLASHKMTPSNEGVAFVREVMETVAARFGGEYDGWDAEVVP
jgi:hypothetical protein